MRSMIKTSGMKNQTAKRQPNQRGMASIIVTMVTMVVISLIVLGFAVLSRREQRQTLDQQLSTQAFYAAESGIEDARSKIKDAIATSQPIAAKDDCTKNNPGGNYPTGNGMVIDAANQVSYTCLKVDPAPTSLLYSGVGSSNVVVPVTTPQTIDKLEVTWTPTTAPSGTPGDCPTSITNNFTPQDKWGCGYGLLRADIVPTTGTLTRASLTANALNGFFVPTRSGSAGILTYGGNTAKPNIVAANCNTGSYTQCKATITGINATNISLRLSSMYQPSNLSIVSYHNGVAMGMTGAQAKVDATGKAVDVLRRIQVRLPVVDTGGLLPGAALTSNGAICKRFSVSSGYFEIPADIINRDTKNDMCNPVVSSAASGNVVASATDPAPTGSVPGNWKLTFNDDFDGSALDSSQWGTDNQPGNNPDETACFSPSAVSVASGALNISLTNQSCQGKQNTGGQVYTKTFRQTYGYFEAKMNLPGKNGKTYNFPAFWILPYKNGAVCWPTGGEFDIMETIGGGASAHYGYGSSCDNVSNNWPAADPGGGDWTGWHTFAVDWEPGSFTVYYDGKKVGNAINDLGVKQPMNIVLDNVSRPMGGQTVTGTKIQVDYVRAWTKQ